MQINANVRAINYSDSLQYNMFMLHKEQLKSNQTHTNELVAVVVLATLVRTNADYVTVPQTLFCGTCSSSYKFEFTSSPVSGCYRKPLKVHKSFL